jgi:arylsulfatase A
LTGVPLPPGQAEDSFDVWRAFTENTPGPAVRSHVILQAADATYAVRQADWKWIERSGGPEFESKRNKRKTEQAAKKKRAPSKPDELYDLKEDPAEAKNILPANSPRGEEMKKLLNQARERGYTRPGASP